MLARREHSRTELLQKLRKKNFLDTDIDLVLDKLVEEGLLSDSRFIENYIHYQRHRGYGPLRIRNDLLERGVNKNSIEHHLDIQDNAWLMSIRQVWRKRFKKSATEPKARATQMRFLQYRGFTHDQIKSVMNDDEEY